MPETQPINAVNVTNGVRPLVAVLTHSQNSDAILRLMSPMRVVLHNSGSGTIHWDRRIPNAPNLAADLAPGSDAMMDAQEIDVSLKSGEAAVVLLWVVQS